MPEALREVSSPAQGPREEAGLPLPAGGAPATRGELVALAPALLLVFVAMLGVMFVFELAKMFMNPNITLWESHAITIVFTSIVAMLVVFLPLLSFHRERHTAEEALRLRLEAEERLRHSEMQYRSFIESAGDSIYAVDREGRYLLINSRHLARRGFPAEGYTGRHYGDFHSAEETIAFTRLLEAVIITRSLVQDEYERDGRYYLRKLNPVIDPLLGEVVAVTVISSDITGQKLAEKNLEVINRKLNLVNDITRHDILNQLTALTSFLALAGERPNGPDQERYIRRCGEIVDTIQGQIFFARDYQKIGMESPQWQNVCGAIQRARLPLELPAVRTGRTCRDWEIYADPLLEKVFFNLMENAVRYAGPRPELRFTVEEDEGRLIIACEDNGPGIPEADKERIFRRGFGKNTGLGLFLIRDILGITGISIRENGTAGLGSRFEIAVPAGAYRHAAGP